MGDENTLLTDTEVRHLLRRTGFDVKPRRLKLLTGKKRGYAANSLVRGAGSRFKPKVRYNIDDSDLQREMHDSWLNMMITTTRQFQEKLVLFWHDHFACNNLTVSNLTLMANQNQLLRKHSKGHVRNQNFKDFVKAINKDAAMMEFLDTVRNRKNAPNENYPRELMELFTLGVKDFAGNDNYTQDDIVQIARAFSGWRYNTESGNGLKYGEAFLNTSQHHTGSPKTIFTTVGGFPPGGRDITEDGTGEGEIDKVIDIIFEHRDTDGKNTVARHITSKLLTYLAGINPPASVVDEIITASNFDGADVEQPAWELSALLRAILVHDFFYASAGQPQSVRWPIHYVVSTMRTLKMRFDSTKFQKTVSINGSDKEITVSRAHLLNDTSGSNPIRSRLERMGQVLFEPPSVFGWDWETAWTNSGTMLDRYAFAVRIARARGTGLKAFRPEKLIDKTLTEAADIVDAVTAVLQLQENFPPGSAGRDALIDYITEDGTKSPPFSVQDEVFRNTKLHGLFCLLLESPIYQLQ